MAPCMLILASVACAKSRRAPVTPALTSLDGVEGAAIAYIDRPMLDQVQAMASGHLSSASLTLAYMDRIRRRDGGPKGLHTILRLNPQAVADAEKLDHYRSGAGLLFGAVILLKDNIDTAGLATTGGSVALEGNVPTVDAAIVQRLRGAHAVLLGKTNLSEWANFRSERSTSGWSSLGGQTRNGFNPAYNPSGSSSGSAAAVAAGLASAAIGTETDGSIVSPASVNGIVGFKPTVGLVSRTGIIPISSSQDTAGPLTKTVADAARLMTVLAHRDPTDPASRAIPVSFDFDFEKGLSVATLRGLRLGMVTTLMGYDASVDALFRKELERIRVAGATVVPVALPDEHAYAEDERKVLLFEFKAGINKYLASHARTGQPSSLAELIAFNEARAAIVMPHFEQDLFRAAEATSGLSDPAYLAAKAALAQHLGREGILAILTQHGLDALVAPTSGVAWVTDYAHGDAVKGGASAPPAVNGYPHLTVPMGRIGGLPVGLSIFAGPFQDARVLAIGCAYERIRS